MNGVFLSHDVMPKVILILMSAALLLFAPALWAAGLRSVWNRRRGRLFLALALAQAASLALSTAFSARPALSLAGTVWRRFGAAEQMAALLIAVAAASLAAADSRWRERLLRAISVTGAIASVYGIAQYFGIDPFLDPALYTIDSFGGIIRPPATMGHAIYFSAWLAPVALLALSGARSETNLLWKRIHGATAALSPAAILLSGSRGALLGLLAGLLLLLARSPRPGGFVRGVAIAAAGFAIAAGVVVMTPAGGNLRHRLYQWIQDPGGPRSRLWRESPALAWRHPLLGTGPETFGAEFRRIESAEFSRAYPEFYHETPHNAFLDAATAQGLPGLLILIGAFAVGWTGKPRPGAEGAALEAALLAILVCSLFASFSLVEYLYLWAISGISATIKLKDAAADKSLALGFLLTPAALAGGALAVLAILLAVPDAADARLYDAVNAKDAAKDATAAFRWFDTAQTWTCSLPGYQLWRSREMATLGRTSGNSSQAAAAWHRAMDASASAEAFGEEPFSAAFQSSVLAIASGDLTRAEAKAREAILMAPNWYKPHLFLGQILTAMGRKDEGSAEEAAARALAGPKM